MRDSLQADNGAEHFQDDRGIEMPQAKVSNEFVADTDIMSAEVNENFADLVSAVNAIDDDKIADQAISGTKIKIEDDGIPSNRLKDGAVTPDKLAIDAVLTAKIKDAQVTAEKLAIDSVLEDKIKNEEVTTPKLAADAVQQRELKFDSTDLTLGDGWRHVNGSSQSIVVATGERVIVQALLELTSTNNLCVEVQLLRDSTKVQESLMGHVNLAGGDPNTFPLSGLWFDVPSAGTYTYSLQIKRIASSDTMKVIYATVFYTVDRGK